jgi:DNA damage-inducible protein 1
MDVPKIRVTLMLGEQVFPLEVAEDTEIRDIRALCEFETSIPASDIALIWHGQVLRNPTKTLKNYGVTNDDLILLERASAMQQSPSAQRPQQRSSGIANLLVPAIHNPACI